MCCHATEPSANGHTSLLKGLSKAPARMCRQVRNLRSCIKVALDFVSPESLSQLEQLAKDRRALALQETGPPDQKCALGCRPDVLSLCTLRYRRVVPDTPLTLPVSTLRLPLAMQVVR